MGELCAILGTLLIVFLLVAAVGHVFWLIIVAIGASAVSLYYYLQILKQAYVLPSLSGPSNPIPFASKVPIIALAFLVLLLGCLPSLLLDPLQQLHLPAKPLVAASVTK